MTESDFEMAQDGQTKLVTLTELAHLRRLQKYQKRKRDQVEARLHRLQTSCEVRARIVQSAGYLQHELTDSIQAGNRKKFALLYHTFQTFRQACDEWDAQSPELKPTENLPPDQQGISFLDGVSPDARNSLLVFLSRVAFDPQFLLDCLLNLSNPEFSLLLKPRSQGSTGHSWLGSPPRTAPEEVEQESFRRFLDFSRCDILAFLLRLVPRNGKDLDGLDSSPWGVVCAGLLSQQKPGSDKFVVTVMNAHTEQLERTARHNLEIWFLETLNDGAFIVNQNGKHPSRTKSHTPKGHSMDDRKTVDDFFSSAISKLLRLLKDNKLTKIVPANVLNLGKAIVARLASSSQQQQAAPYFLCTRWLFASYLSSLITSPEAHGLLLSHHISSIARQRVLNEVAHRAKQSAESVAYSWKQTTVDSRLVADIESVVSLFRLDQPDFHCPFPSNEARIEIRTDEHAGGNNITVCASEVIGVVHALCPEQRGDMFHSFHSIGGSTLRSSASSISGMSLFRTTSPCESTSLINGNCDTVPEDGSPQEIPYPGSFPENLFSNSAFTAIEGQTFVPGLREACNELVVMTEYDPYVGTCDLFSEKWTNLIMDPGSKSVSLSRHADLYPLGKTEPYRSTDEEHLDAGTSNFFKTGISILLDGHPPVAFPDRVSKIQDIKGLHASLANHFESARATCYHRGDFAQAHLFFRLAKQVNSLTPGLTAKMMHDIATSLQQSIDSSCLTIQDSRARIEELAEIAESQQARLRAISYTNDRLREKMWYIADIQPANHYEDLCQIVSALRAMASPISLSAKKKQPPLRHRTASRSLSQDLQAKAEAAALELLSAPVARGGANKLSDVQIDMTLRWMELRGVEKICRAEERIHRFCSELSRCLDRFVGHSTTESPILWSSELFQDQRPLSSMANGSSGTPVSDSTALEQLRSLYVARAPSVYDNNSHWARSSTPLRPGVYTGFAGRSTSPRSNHEYFGCRSPTLTHKSSGTLWSSFSGGPQSPSSATSFPSRALSPISAERPLSRRSCLQRNQNSFLEELRQNLTSLLLSDFDNLFRSGSETDKALRRSLKTKLSKQDLTHVSMDLGGHASTSLFDFEKVFRMLLRRFELQANPYAKLDILLELQTMLRAHRAESVQEDGPFSRHDSLEPTSNLFVQNAFGLRIDTSTAPRPSSGHDTTILCFRQLFQKPDLRPKTLFRDLQYIASLVPLSILDSTSRGRAFWNAAIAALDLKQEICQGMIETADQIIHHHTFNRGHSRVTSAAQAKRDAAAFSPSIPQPNDDTSIADLGMSDAAILLQLTAKEGIPAAQRELATLYLTHPELLSVCISPFSRLRDVFKDDGQGKKEKEMLSERYDPVAMAVAQHWMELSAKGGDGPAARYLRAKDEFDRIP